MANNNSPQTGESQDTRTIVTILLLVFLNPIGVIVMYVWSRWKLWVKLLVTLISFPFLIAVAMFVIVFVLSLLTAINPQAQVSKAQCVKECAQTNDPAYCTKYCADQMSGGTQKLPAQLSPTVSLPAAKQK